MRFLILLASLLIATPAAASTANSFAIRDVRLFDGQTTREQMDVVVRDGRIAMVGKRLRIPAGLTVIDGAGKTLLPGFVDSHVHVIPGAQADALRFGVTTLLDMFTLRPDFPAWRTQRDSLAQVTGADTWSAGLGVSSPGGHPARMLPPDMKMPTLVEAADAKAFVDARVAEGSDYVKLILEENAVTDPSIRLPTLSRETLCAAIAAAHARRKMTIVHVSTLANARMAVECGADGLAHLFSEAPDAAFIALAKQRNIFVISTLSVIAGISGLTPGAALAADPRIAPLLSEAQKRSILPAFATPQPHHYPGAFIAARALHAAGIPLLAGTDSPGPGTAHGVSIHGELRLLVEAGMTPGQALAAATSLPAARFHLSDRGRIAPGYRADLILIDGNPTATIADTLSIAAIWKNGYPVDRQPR